MTIRVTSQGCTVETTYISKPDDVLIENITLSTQECRALSLAVEETPGKPIDAWMAPRYRK